MTYTPKMLAAVALLSTAALMTFGCADSKRKGAPANQTGGETSVDAVEETTVIEEDMPRKEEKEQPEQAEPEPSTEPPAPAEKPKEATDESKSDEPSQP